MGMTETSNPSFPLIADAPATGGTSAVYKTDQTVKGGVWKGRKAIVIRCDQSGSVENCRVKMTMSRVLIRLVPKLGILMPFGWARMLTSDMRFFRR